MPDSASGGPDATWLDDITVPPPAPAPAPTPSPTPAPQPSSDSWLDDLEPERSAAHAAIAKVVVDKGLATDPSRAANLIALQGRTGLPTEFIDRNYDAVLQEAQRQDFNAQDFLKKSPVIGAWLKEDPARIGLTRNDLPQLAAVESLLRSSPFYHFQPDGSIVEQFPNSDLANRYESVRGLRDALRSRGESQLAAEEQQKAAEDYLGNFGWLKQLAAGGMLELAKPIAATQKFFGYTDASADTKQTLQALQAASEHLSPGLWGSLQRQTGSLFADLPLLAAGGPVAEGLVGITRTAAGAETLSPLLMRALQGAGVMQPLAITNALETAQDQGVGAGLGSWAVDSGIAGLFGPVGASRLVTRMEGLGGDLTAKSGAGVLAKQAVLAGGQNMAFSAGHAILDHLTGADPHALDADRFKQSMLESGLFGGLTGGLFALPEAREAAKHFQANLTDAQRNAASSSVHAAETLRAAADHLGQTKSMQLNQDAMQEPLSRVVEATKYKTLYVDAQAWRARFDDLAAKAAEAGEQAPDARAIAADVTGDPRAYDKALEANGLIAIPGERFLGMAAKPEHRDWLTTEMRTAPDAMNEREALEMAKQALTQGAVMHTTGNEDADFSASSDLVREDIRAQTRATGKYSESDSEAFAHLGSKLFSTAAARRGGVLPHELYQQSKLRLERMRDTMPSMDVIDALIARAKAGDIPSEADVAKSASTEEGDHLASVRASVQNIRDLLTGLGADIDKESPEQLKARLFAGQEPPHVVKGRNVVVTDVPYGGGTSQDGKTIYIDRRIPRYHMVDGKRIDLHQMIAEHEIAEKERMDRGETYSKAHGEALAIEDKDVDHQGVSHQDYENLLKPYLDQAKKEATKDRIPADIEPKPYRDMGETHLIEGARGETRPYEQPPLAIQPSGESLRSEQLLKQWRKAMGDRTPLGGTDSWMQLQREAMKEDAKRGVFYQDKPGSEPQGTFMPGRLSASGENIISIARTADVSTWIHEFGHFTLEFMHDIAESDSAPQQMKDDLAAIRASLGVKDGEAIPREMHEQFARTLERYIMEGKAPSDELKPVFRRFAEILKTIYKTLTALRAPMSDDVRNVFDRLFATDDEIDRARSQEGASTLMFKTQADSGMSDRQWKAYVDDSQTGRERGVDILKREVMHPLLEQETKEYKSDRERMRAEVSEELDNEPVYRAINALQKDRYANGEDIPEANRVKLDKDDLVERYGEAGLKLLPGPKDHDAERPNRGKRIYATEGGVSLDDAAEMFGFKDGGDLWHALINAPDHDAEIERRTDDQLARLRDDPMRDGSIQDRARAAALNDVRFATMEQEADALALKSGRAATPSDLLKAVARKEIGKQKAMDVQPAAYRTAMVRAARDAGKALGEGKPDEALRHKTNQILQAHLYRESMSALKRIEKNRDYMKSIMDPDKRKRIGKAGGEDFVVTSKDPRTGAEKSEAFNSIDYGGSKEAQQAALKRAQAVPGSDVITSGYLAKMDEILSDVDLTRLSPQRLARRESLQSFVQRMEAANQPVAISQEVIDSLGKTNWRQMTLDQQARVVEALKNLEHLAKLKNTLIANATMRSFTEAKESWIGNMKANKFRTIEPDGIGPKGGVVSAIGDFIAAHGAVDRYVLEMDGNDRGGKSFEVYQRPLVEAEARKSERMAADIEKVLELQKEWGRGMTPLDLRRLRQMEPDADLGVKVSHWGRIMLALNWGNEGNRSEILKGYDWKPEQVHAALAKLSDKDMRFVQGVFDLIDSHWPEMKAQLERMYGFAPEKVEAVPIIHHTGVYRGGYFPLEYDRSTVSRDMVENAANPSAALARMRGVIRGSYTKERVGSQDGAKINLSDPGIIARHLNNVVHDLAFTETLVDHNKLLNDRDIRETMQSTWGNRVYDQFRSQLSALGLGVQMAKTGMEPQLRYLRTSTNFANRALRVGQAVVNLASLPLSLPRLGPKYWAIGLAHMFHDPTRTDSVFKWVDDQDATMAARSRTRDRNLNDALGQINFDTPALKTAQAYGMYLWNKSWQIVDTHTWLGAYAKEMDRSGDMAKARAVATQTVIDLQGSGAIKDLPQIGRGGPLAQVFTANMSWWFRQGNLIAENVNRGTRGYKTGDLGEMVKAAASLTMYLGVVPAMYVAANAAVTGKDKDVFLNAADQPKELALRLARESGYTALSSFVFFHDLADVITEGSRFRGPAGLHGLNALTSAIADVSNAVRKDEPLTAGGEKAVLGAASTFLYLPWHQMADTWDGLHQALQNGQSPIAPAIFGPSR